MTNADWLLPITLGIAVPIAIADLRLDGCNARVRADVLLEHAPELADEIAGNGDAILAGIKDRKTVVKSFADTARGIAVLAHLPGGVKFAGNIWCAAHFPAGRVTDERTCPDCTDTETETP